MNRTVKKTKGKARVLAAITADYSVIKRQQSGFMRPMTISRFSRLKGSEVLNHIENGKALTLTQDGKPAVVVVNLQAYLTLMAQVERIRAGDEVIATISRPRRPGKSRTTAP